MVILTLNCGSSSAKYQLYDWEQKEVLASGVVERVTAEGASIEHLVPGREACVIASPCPTHTEAVELIMRTITDPKIGVLKDLGTIGAVGHRIVQGGEKFTKSVVVTPEVIGSFRDVSDLAPLHNPANILGIEAAQKVLPKVPHCAIMDTAWHQTMPPECYLYPVPYEWYEKYGVRRYGFHGTSFLYTSKRAAVLLHKNPLDCTLIIAHIGNGASINAVKKGVSYNTSMGLTPLEGLVMGTRSGDVDPALPLFVMRKTGMGAAEMDSVLNKKSGLLGVSGKYTDRRDIQKALEAGDKRSLLANEMECHVLRRYIGSSVAELGGADALVFTAGVGEFSPLVREKACRGLEAVGIKLDPRKNALAHTRNAETCISADDSKVKIFVIPTDEELVMTEDAQALMSGTYDVHTNFTYSFQKPDYENKARAEGLKKDLAKLPELAGILAG